MMQIKDKYPQVTLCEHPLIQDAVIQIRDKNTPSSKFRALIEQISQFLIYEATKDIKVKKTKVETVLGTAEGSMVVQHKIIFCPILRAGLGMLQPVLNVFPDATVWHLGLYRNEETLQPVEYYVKLPDKLPKDSSMYILDPMLATGGSAAASVTILKKRGIKNINFISIISATKGIENLLEHHPDIKIYTSAIDKIINENGYIVPGLGDAGNRIYNTF